MKGVRKIQVIVSQFQQFTHKTSSSAFTNRESTFIVSCEKRCERHTLHEIKSCTDPDPEGPEVLFKTCVAMKFVDDDDDDDDDDHDHGTS